MLFNQDYQRDHNRQSSGELHQRISFGTLRKSEPLRRIENSTRRKPRISEPHEKHSGLAKELPSESP
jgi:hypothetical protein